MIKIKLAHRLAKVMLLLSCALLLSIVCVDNIVAYDINFEYIQHIMSMDTTFKHPHLYWRAVNNPIFYHLCFGLIILIEGIVSILLWIGVYHLFKNLRRGHSDFQLAKQWGLMGLSLALILYSLIFFVIASQWFASWQSSLWNAKDAAIPFIILLGLTYLILAKEDEG
jgi:predicted small integral membrane protein